MVHPGRRARRLTHAPSVSPGTGGSWSRLPERSEPEPTHRRAGRLVDDTYRTERPERSERPAPSPPSPPPAEANPAPTRATSKRVLSVPERLPKDVERLLSDENAGVTGLFAARPERRGSESERRGSESERITRGPGRHRPLAGEAGEPAEATFTTRSRPDGSGRTNQRNEATAKRRQA